MRTLVRSLRLWVFDRLYNEAAWAYDTAAMVAGGRFWYAWGQAVLPFVQPGSVLEVGIGRGKLLPALAAAGHWPLIGVDLAPAMLKAAKITLHTTATPATLIRAEGGVLPFPDGTFNTLITTFPAPYVKLPETQCEFARVLRVGGRWLWVDAPRGGGKPTLQGGLTTLFCLPPMIPSDPLAVNRNIFGQDTSGVFLLQVEQVPVGPTTVSVRIATRIESEQK
jgi:ubiquinone/menaquinone biosynthesis C-methylase UbiE